ncbi:hypothetical protein Tsubulata_044853 [Turnera subulata]|uniref:peptidylprolyl isomerase n=1 Tax=Turnera subulata TaxID=218843 RepID=A0A9Q0JHL4_9ROSI|nr:hypothetical protein Tsubulata_044853 [Turnera subulata]
MEVVVKTLFTGLTLQPSKSVKEKEVLHCFIPNLSTKPQSFSRRVRCRTQRYWRRENYRRVGHVCAVVSEDVGVSSSRDVLVTRSTNQEGELKISVEVSGARTRVIFDEVFDRMVAAAQPIPGFRRAKGGKLNDSCLTANGDVDTRKTPNVPRDVLLQILGPSKVYKEVIKKVINSTVAEYVEKESFKVSKELRVEQSFEELEDAFEPHEKFCFTAVLGLQETN